MHKTQLELTCPRGRKTRRTVYGHSTQTIRCVCGCHTVWKIRP
jgi:ribosomal protein S27E